LKTKVATNETARKVRCRLLVKPVFLFSAGVVGTGRRFGTSGDFGVSMMVAFRCRSSVAQWG
jgi:hypothetical protein